MTAKTVAGLALAVIIFFIIALVEFSLLREQGKKIAMMEAANEGLIKELSNVNRRIALANEAKKQGQQFKAKIGDANEKNRDWAGDVVPADVVNELCTQIDCAESKLQM